MRLLSVLLALSFAPVVWAAIDGTVTNGTTSAAQASVSLILVKPGQQGMQTLGSTVSDAQGHFHFEKDQPGGGPQLIQAQYEGVTYTTLLTPNMSTSAVDVRIYEATKSAAVAQIAQHMIVVEPSQSQTAVNETVIVRNASTQTFYNPEWGGFQFFLPPAANGQVRISVQGPGGMPLSRPAEKTPARDIFKVDYPIKPGETQFTIVYVLPVGSPLSLRGRIAAIPGQPTGPVRFVVPSGVSMDGADIRALGQEPQTQATIYDLLKPEGYAVNVTGTGALTPASDDMSSDSDGTQIEEKNPPLYRYLPWLTGLALGILLVGLLLLFRSSPVEPAK